MEGSFILFVLLFMATLFIVGVFLLYSILAEIKDLRKTINDTIQSDYKTIEKNAETALAEDYAEGENSVLDKPEEDSLYLTKDHKYSYKVYAENKKKRKEGNLDKYIDEFEEAAVKAERIEPNGR